MRSDKLLHDADARQGITLTPPNAQVAQEYDVRYNMDYWGTETPIYATYGDGAPAALLSMCLFRTVHVVANRVQRYYALPWQPCPA